MTKYTIAIEETIVKEFEVFADNTAVAMRIAEKKYKEGDFILNPGEVQFTQMSVVNPTDISLPVEELHLLKPNYSTVTSSGLMSMILLLIDVKKR